MEMEELSTDFLFSSTSKQPPYGDLESPARKDAIERIRQARELAEEEGFPLWNLEREDFINGEYGEPTHRLWFRNRNANFDFVIQHEMFNADVRWMLQNLGGTPYDEVSEDQYDEYAPPRPAIRSVLDYADDGPMQNAQEDMSYALDHYYDQMLSNGVENESRECEDCFKVVKLRNDGTMRKHKCILILEVVA